MEKRYLVVIQRMKDGTEARGLYQYTEQEAIEAFYSNLSYSASNANVTSCICVIADYNFSTIKYEKYVRIEQPEPQPEEEQTEETN